MQTVRGKVRDSFGPFPEKARLNARVTKVVERDSYKIENVLFESRGPSPVFRSAPTSRGADSLVSDCCQRIDPGRPQRRSCAGSDGGTNHQAHRNNEGRPVGGLQTKQ